MEKQVETTGNAGTDVNAAASASSMEARMGEDVGWMVDSGDQDDKWMRMRVAGSRNEEKEGSSANPEDRFARQITTLMNDYFRMAVKKNPAKENFERIIKEGASIRKKLEEVKIQGIPNDEVREEMYQHWVRYVFEAVKNL